MRKQLLIVGVSALLIGGGSGFVGGFVATQHNSPVAISSNSAPEIIVSPSPVFSPSPVARTTPTPKVTPQPVSVPIVTKPTPKPIIKPSPKPTPRVANHVTWNDPTAAIVSGEIDGPTIIGTGVPMTVTGNWLCSQPLKYGFSIGLRDLNTMVQIWKTAQVGGVWTIYFDGSSIPGHSYLLMVQIIGDSSITCDWNLTVTL